MDVEYDFVTVSPDSDSYTTSAPLTPSPPTISNILSPFKYTNNNNNNNMAVNIQDDHYSDSPFFNNHSTSHRGSLLSELYSQDESNDYYSDSYHLQHFSPNNNNIHQSLSPLPPHLHDHPLSRRASYPSVRHDREDNIINYSPAFLSDSNNIYCEPLPINDSQLVTLEPYNLHPHHHQQQHHQQHHQLHSHHFHSNTHPPHLEDSSYLTLDPTSSMDGIKLEDGIMPSPPVIVPSQHMFYPRPGSSSSSCSSNGMSPMPMYMSPHGAIPIQHTDDAASKETQYLRRRCNNCHTTEPPSWRRSTLNPGKIVCNKCGLYERTHLRPRPHRFDELRAGNKARKHSSATSTQTKILGVVNASMNSPSSPKDKLVKKEQAEFEFESGNMRRGSVSSASIHSASSDYDDAVSVYSSTGSIGTPSSYNSPLLSSFAVPRLSPSQSPPLHSADSPGSGTTPGGIRIPNTPMCDIASLQLQSAPGSPRKSNSNGSLYYGQQTNEYYNARRTSMPMSMSMPMPVDILQQQQQIQLQQRVNGGSVDSNLNISVSSSSSSSSPSTTTNAGVPDVTGWQAIQSPTQGSPEYSISINNMSPVMSQQQQQQQQHQSQNSISSPASEEDIEDDSAGVAILNSSNGNGTSAAGRTTPRKAVSTST